MSCFTRNIITARKRSLGQGNIFTPVCHSVHRGEYLGRYPPGPGTPPRTKYTPQDQVPPPGPGTPPRTRYTSRDKVHPLKTSYTPQDQLHPPWDHVHPPQTRYTPGTRYTTRDQVPPRPGTPPGAVHAGRYGQQAGGTHPTGIHSCFIVGCVLFYLPCDRSM